MRRGTPMHTRRYGIGTPDVRGRRRRRQLGAYEARGMGMSMNE